MLENRENIYDKGVRDCLVRFNLRAQLDLRVMELLYRVIIYGCGYRIFLALSFAACYVASKFWYAGFGFWRWGCSINLGSENRKRRKQVKA